MESSVYLNFMFSMFVFFSFSLAREYAQEAEHEYSDKLKRVQTIIIDLTSAISRYGDTNQKPIPNVYTKELEDWISEYSKHLPPPEQYIIPVRVAILVFFYFILLYMIFFNYQKILSELFSLIFFKLLMLYL